MKTTYHPGVHRFAVFTVCWTVLLLIAGALVTSNDAALSVPDWPKSFGTWTPPMVGGVFYEHSHRVIAGILGVWTLILAVLLWVKEERRWLRWFALIAVGGIVVQAILGGQVVIQLLHYWLPVLHACFAQIMFGAILSIAVFTSKWWVTDRPQLEDRGSPSIHSLAVLNGVVSFLQVFLGADHHRVQDRKRVYGWRATILQLRTVSDPPLARENGNAQNRSEHDLREAGM